MTDRSFICQNPKCGRRKTARFPSEAKIRKYCSRRCSACVHGGVLHMSLEARRAAAEKSKRVRRANSIARLQGMTPIAIYRMGFSNGWKAGVRSARRRMGMVAA